MSSHKRKHFVADEDNSESDGFSEVALSDDEIDISSALTSKRQKLAENDDSDDDDLRNIMAQSIAKRNVKGGVEVVKNAKGKSKLVKGEVGGGSFQSMGTS